MLNERGPLMIKRCLQVIDDFYDRPDEVRQKALLMSYAQPDGFVGWRTLAYQPKGIKQTIERRFKISIRYWEKDLAATEASNGVFFSAFSKGKFAERVGIHYDDPAGWMMLLVYLTPDALLDAGTSTWQHRETGLIAKPTRQDASRLGMSLKALEMKLIEDSHKLKSWREVDRIGNVYNRAVMFPSRLLHSATKHFGRNHLEGRLYQAFHFPIRRAR
uniref:Uncharacterized protein n=1 Tax=uncultured Acidobacteriota bacterium TaxID=171953 RepID=Q7X2T7_9BACT|nr:hypothetical protein [uncultured Acidobacteriota bacterium]